MKCQITCGKTKRSAKCKKHLFFPRCTQSLDTPVKTTEVFAISSPYTDNTKRFQEHLSFPSLSYHVLWFFSPAPVYQGKNCSFYSKNIHHIWFPPSKVPLGTRWITHTLKRMCKSIMKANTNPHYINFC